MAGDPRLLLWPIVALAALTFLVCLRLFVVRIGEMRRLRIAPQSVATSVQAGQRFVDTRAADNFRNLFELPVLFYAALLIAFAIQAVDAIGLTLAWTFVAVRIAHSAIQCGYNRVVHRFAAHATGVAVLIALWVWLTWRLLP